MKSDNFIKYVSLLKCLHRLIREDKSDTQEADDLRDEMERPWYSLTKEEQAEVRELSEMMYEDGKQVL